MVRIEDELFCIETKNSGYYMAKRGGLVENLHYGGKLHVNAEVLSEKMAVGYGTDVV